MNMIPVYSLSNFAYNKDRKSLSMPCDSGSLPQRFQIQSNHTGKVVEFAPVPFGHPLFDEDGWDGEQLVYIPTEKLPNVESATIYFC